MPCLLSALLFLATIPATVPSTVPATSQTPLPSGLYLPVHLTHQLSARSSHAGLGIQVRTTQRIPLPGGAYLPRNTELNGTVVASSPGTLTFRFTSIQLAGKPTPIATATRAIATFTEVSNTGIPTARSTDTNDSAQANYTTAQVGGQQVARSGWSGPLLDQGTAQVGTADFHGVYTLPATAGPTAGLPLALGVFSTNATGLFGFDAKATLSSTNGQTTITAPRKLSLHGNDNLLLQLIPTSSALN